MMLLTAAAAPVLVFWMRKRVRKENAMTRVFVAPISIKNSFGSLILVMVFPMIAPWLAPRLGSRLQRGAAMSAPRIGFVFFDLGNMILCFGICVLFFILVIRMLAPNSPVSIGSRGSVMF